MDNQNLFSQSYDQIMAQAVGGSNKNFQLLGNPINFSWPVAPTGQSSLQAYQIMSVQPNYSAVGTYSAGSSTFFDAYKRLLSLVTFKVDPAKQNDLDGLSNQVTDANNKLQAKIVEMNSAYQVAKQNGGIMFETQYPTIQDWINGPGSTFSSQIDTLTAAVKTLSDQYAAFLADFSSDPTIQEDFKKVQKPTGPVSGPTPDGWTKVPNSNGNLEWQPNFNIGTTGQNWRAKLTSGSAGALNIQLDASKTSSNLNKSWAGGSAGYNAGFWAVQGGGGWSQTDIFNSDSSISCTIKTESSTLVPVTPGSWYDGGLMKSLAKNEGGYGAKLTPPWSATGSGDNVAFGKDGLLSCYITGLVVAYKPSFEMEMASSTYTKHETEIKASLGIRIGPFTFGAKGGHTSIKIDTTGNRTKITNTSTSDDPLIIGMTVAFPGLD